MLLTIFHLAYYIFTLISNFQPVKSQSRNNAVFRDMELLTKRLGQSIFEFSNGVTKFNELRDSFSKNGESVEEVNVEELFREVMSRVNGSLQGRVDAIQKLAAFAEPRAFDHYSTIPGVELRKVNPPIPRSYFNSKLINKSPSEDGDDGGGDDDDDEFNCTFPTDLPLARDDHFKTDVNLNFTSVHVPTSIYPCDLPLLEALYWSSDLEDTFKNNYQQNPTLGWQYFGSSTGFLRQYPATQWPNDNSEKNAPDLYDCRFRPWYTTSATSPKNLLILLDVSGSMTGMRRRIAKAVVNSILDTLTENDYVNVFNFSDTTELLVGCMEREDTGTPILVQATKRNVRDLRVALEQRQTREMANFTAALTKAFDTLKENQNEGESSNCNQAIMLVTDGAPYYFKSLFDEINRRKRIRLFTYLVGKDVTDKNEIQWMACYNQGFFVHVVTLGEVQEQVFKYIPVMARPLVMSQRRQIMWTPVYANHHELIESEWEWEWQTRQRQKVRSERYKWFYQNVARKNANQTQSFPFSDGRMSGKGAPILVLHKVKTFLDYGQTKISYKNIRRMEADKERLIRIFQDSREGPRSLRNSSYATKLISSLKLQSQLLLERNRHMFRDYEFRKFTFIISASFPVFDIRNYTNSTTDPDTKDRIANFLGVVGTDITIDELKNLASPFELGVNAYAFAITNNGHIVFHPDFRPLHENILKPTYNSLDLTEIELMDKDGLHRNNDEELLQMRREMIDKEGPEPSDRKVFTVRIHRDGFRRVKIRNQMYVFGRIPRTLYTLAIQVPVNATVFKGEVEVSLAWKAKGINIVDSYFDTLRSYKGSEGIRKIVERSWRIHPDWIYCRYLTPNKQEYLSSNEDVFLHFIKRIQSSSLNKTWAWGSTTRGWGGRDGDHYTCNKKLVQSVVFDAMITKPFGDSHNILQDVKIKNLVSSFGAEILNASVLTTFIATRSGLTRWVDHPLNREKPTDLPFTEYYPRAIEEGWYQRSVERAEIEEDSLVISVAFDAGTQNYSRVTVTRAMMASKRNKKKAPVAVVGIQYDLDKFLSFFGLGPEARTDPRNVCQRNDFNCFILDENGFLIGSADRDESGQFFGEVDRYVMDALINSSIYKEVRVTDFQAVCLQQVFRTSFGNVLLTPFRHISIIFKWFLGYLASALVKINFPITLSLPFVSTQAEYEDEEDLTNDRNMPFVEYAFVNKTKLRPCDVEYKLYTYGDAYTLERRTLDRRARSMCDETCDDYLSVQRIPYTNLILVIVEAKCRCAHRSGYRFRRWIRGREIEYPIYKKFVNHTSENPILLEVCRTPQVPLYRKRPLQCHAYAEDEFIMKEDCGWASPLKESRLLIIAATFLSARIHPVLF